MFITVLPPASQPQLSLMSVRVLNTSPAPLNLPTLGDGQATRVTIENNDDANGVWRLYSNSPEATDGGQMLSIEEQPGLSVSVELVIERGGKSRVSYSSLCF